MISKTHTVFKENKIVSFIIKIFILVIHTLKNKNQTMKLKLGFIKSLLKEI